MCFETTSLIGNTYKHCDFRQDLSIFVAPPVPGSNLGSGSYVFGRLSTNQYLATLWGIVQCYIATLNTMAVISLVNKWCDTKMSKIIWEPIPSEFREIYVYLFHAFVSPEKNYCSLGYRRTKYYSLATPEMRFILLVGYMNCTYIVRHQNSSNRCRHDLSLAMKNLGIACNVTSREKWLESAKRLLQTEQLCSSFVRIFSFVPNPG